MELNLEEIYEYRLTNGDIVRWPLKDILPLMEDMGGTYVGCIVNGRLKKGDKMEKLKIGDFVRHKGDEGVFEILSIADLGDTILYSDGNRSHREEKLKLWQPKEGEWCWFEVQKRNYPSAFVWGFGKYIENGICEIMGYKTNFINCEPFTKKIPSFLKADNV